MCVKREGAVGREMGEGNRRVIERGRRSEKERVFRCDYTTADIKLSLPKTERFACSRNIQHILRISDMRK